MTTGGFAGVHMTPATEGYNQTYIFNADFSWLIAKGAETKHGYYTTGQDSVSYPGHVMSTIDMDDLGQFTITFNLDTLFLNAYCCDRYNYVLVKQ